MEGVEGLVVDCQTFMVITLAMVVREVPVGKKSGMTMPRLLNGMGRPRSIASVGRTSI